MTDKNVFQRRQNLKNEIFKLLGSFCDTDAILTKLNNICGKTGQYDVPTQLYQKRTCRKNRVLIPWKTVRNNNLGIDDLNLFEGGCVVEFVNDDFFDDVETSPVFYELKRRLGSDENVSAIISIRSENGSSSSSVPRAAFEKLKSAFPDYQSHLLQQVESGGCGNEKWSGFIYYSIRGGQQDVIMSHSKEMTLFNPACEYASADVSQDINLVLGYFALRSIQNPDTDIMSLIKRTEQELASIRYDSGDLLTYCKHHPCLTLGDGMLTDPIQMVPIKVTDFAIQDKMLPQNLDIAHDEAVNKDLFYVDKTRGAILSPARPTNLFWSRHLSNMMQQNFSLSEYFEYAEKLVMSRKEKLAADGNK